jgi:hypothetical protein
LTQGKLGNLDTAIRCVQASIQIKALPLRLLVICNLLRLAGKFAESLPYALEALNDSNFRRSAELACAHAYHGLGRFEEALQYYQMLAKGPKPRPEGVVGTMFVLKELGRHDAEATSRAFSVLYPTYQRKFPIRFSQVLSLSEWLKVTPLARSKNVELAAEITIQNKKLGSRPLRYLAPSTFYVVVPGGSIYCGWDYAVAPDDIVLDGSGYRDISRQKLGPLLHIYNNVRKQVAHEWAEQEIRIDVDALFLSGPPDHHFGHWVLDFLPRLRALDLVNLPSIKVFIQGSLPSHHRETLSKFGLQAERIIEGQTGVKYTFRNLVFFNHGNSGHTYRPNVENIKFLYRYLGPSPRHMPSEQFSGRTFLARSGTRGGRNISNASDLEMVLSRYSFHTIKRPELTVAEQDKILGESLIVMGILGTDIVSVYQMRPGSHLIVFHFRDSDLAGQTDVIMQVSAICAVIGIHFHAVACAMVFMPGRVHQEHDLFIDIDLLESCLESIVRDPRANHSLEILSKSVPSENSIHLDSAFPSI